MTTTELYKMRAEAIKIFKKAIIKKGGKITPLNKNEKSLLTSDVRLDGYPIKIKVSKNKQVNILFEEKNDGKVSWFSKTRARYLVQIIVAESKAYMINIMGVKDFIANPFNAIEIYRTESGTEAYMIPIKTLLEQSLIVDVIHL